MKRLLLATSVLFRINLCGAPKAETNGAGPAARANAAAPHPLPMNPVYTEPTGIDKSELTPTAKK
jgi:hypothetical protein